MSHESRLAPPPKIGESAKMTRCEFRFNIITACYHSKQADCAIHQTTDLMMVRGMGGNILEGEPIEGPAINE